MINSVSKTLAPPTLSSFGRDLTVAVVGASGGLGSAFAAALESAPAVTRMFTFSRGEVAGKTAKSRWQALDLEDEASIACAAETLRGSGGGLNMVVVATGLLHDAVELQPETAWRGLDPTTLQRSFAVNASGPALVAKHFLPLLVKDRKSVFATLSAWPGSNEDNQLGDGHAYLASKAALNMLVRTLAAELAQRNDHALCVALYPGRVDTALARPHHAAAPEGKLFTPDIAAGRLLDVLDGLSPGHSGGLFAWNGQRIPF